MHSHNLINKSIPPQQRNPPKCNLHIILQVMFKVPQINQGYYYKISHNLINKIKQTVIKQVKADILLLIIIDPKLIKCKIIIRV